MLGSSHSLWRATFHPYLTGDEIRRMSVCGQSDNAGDAVGSTSIDSLQTERNSMTARSNLKTLQATSLGNVRLERLPTNTTTRGHPVHRWFNFIAGFSPELVQGCVALSGKPLARELQLLDPFAGCGTAPVTARLLGISAVAYDPHPFFAVISEAKANSPRYWKDIPVIHAAIARGILQRLPPESAHSESAIAFLGKMFQPDVLVAINSARRALEDEGLGENPLAILILSRILDHCCFAATDGIYKAPTSGKRALTPKAALDRVFNALNEDHVEARKGEGLARIYRKSSERMEELADDSIDFVITSPPYLNNFDYAEMTRMYLYFWRMASSWGEITDRVRSQLIVNTTTALKGHKDRQESYRSSLPKRVRSAADLAVATLSQRRTEKAGKKEYDFLVYPYLSQMQQVLRETHRVLKSGAPFHMMVSDAALYGTHLPAPQWLAELMRECGYFDVRCEMVRPRGYRWALKKREGAVAGLGEYYVFGRAAKCTPYVN
jgi:DNA modification methylase